jgi:hypothetical protein
MRVVATLEDLGPMACRRIRPAAWSLERRSGSALPLRNGVNLNADQPG